MYGVPGNTIPGTKISSIDAAEKLLDVANGFDHPFIKEPNECFSAETVRAEILEGAQKLAQDIPEIRIELFLL